MSGRSTSRERRRKRLRAAAFGETFLETTIAARAAEPSERGVIESEKSAPLTRRTLFRDMSTKSLRERRCFVGMLDRKSGAALAAAAQEDVFAAGRLRTHHKSVRLSSLALLRLVGSFHTGT